MCRGMDTNVGISKRCRIWEKPSRWSEVFIRDFNMKPDLLGERETVIGKFHCAQTAANRHGFLMKTVQT
jgi:hypothetical protein